MMDDLEGRAGGAGAAHVEPLLERYRTGELEGQERERVAAHLAECPACAAVLADSEAFAATVGRGYLAGRAMHAADEPDWVGQRAAILARISARPAQGSRWQGWAPQAALAVLALIAVGVLYEVGVREPADAERALAPAGSEPASEGGMPATREDVAEGMKAETKETAAKTGDVAAPPPEPAAAAPADAPADAAVVGEPRQENREGADRREAEARQEVGERAADDEALAAARAAADGPEEAIARGARFEVRARIALADRDTLAAAEALSVWRDSLASGAGLDPARKKLAQALVDSLAAFLASRP
ncbi:hypothetical protein BH18GEM1_BH18GEM1_06060 [soil metagenome]